MSLVTLGIGGAGGTTYITYGLGAGGRGVVCPLNADVSVESTLTAQAVAQPGLTARVGVDAFLTADAVVSSNLSAKASIGPTLSGKVELDRCPS